MHSHNAGGLDLTRQGEVNSESKLVALRDLQLIEKDETAILKDGEESKTKTYRCTGLSTCLVYSVYESDSVCVCV